MTFPTLYSFLVLFCIPPIFKGPSGPIQKRCDIVKKPLTVDSETCVHFRLFILWAESRSLAWVFLACHKS